jgi:hypothetical protein
LIWTSRTEITGYDRDEWDERRKLDRRERIGIGSL